MAISYRLVPFIAAVCLALAWGRSLPLAVLIVLGLVLVAAILTSVHHAEVVAHRVGEPFGSLILAVAVTIIEVALIITLMFAGKEGAETLARDTVFAAIMITCNGIIGAAILVRTWRGGVARFNANGAGSGLAAISLLATLTLVLPTVTTSEKGPVFTPFQLAFAAAASLLIYLLFVFVQTVRHRSYFLAPSSSQSSSQSSPDKRRAPATTEREALISLGLLLLCLVAVVGLAKVTTPLIESIVSGVGLPLAAVAVVIALLVLLPESLAAVRAARRDRFQTSVNLAYGSAMASIGLTIPTIAVASWIFDFDLVLGLTPREITLLGITVVVGILTVTPGRANLLQGGLHLSLFAAFLALVLAP